MNAVPLELLSRVLDARVIGTPGGPVTGVSIDSRSVQAGDLFVAIRGERSDGHDYLAQAAAAGAVAALVSADRLASLSPTLPLLAAPDPVLSLGEWGLWHRLRHAPTVVAVTGSVGKTTTKDLLGAILVQSESTWVSPGNLNTEIGLPLSMLRLRAEHRTAVFEMAMRGAGQIRTLSRLLRPHAVLITNIGSSHLEVLGSRQAIAEAKAEALDFISEFGLAVLPAEGDFAEFLRARVPSGVRVATFGRHGSGADYSVEYLGAQSPGGGLWGLLAVRGPDGRRRPLRVSVPGRHNALNAAAAVAMARELGTGWRAIRDGLATAQVSSHRMTVRRIGQGVTLVDDAYNASSPETMEAALSVLEELPAARKGAVLGSMLELGPASDPAHEAVGRRVAGTAPDYLVTVGEAARRISDTAVRCGLAAERVLHCPDHAAALEALRPRVRPHDLLLIKGSRGIALEHLVEGLCREFPGATA